MPSRELANERAGNPAQFEFIPTSAAAAEPLPEFDQISAGDVLLTCKVDPTVLAARERGAYVAVFTCHRVNHPGIPPGEVTWNSNDERLMPADVASTVVQSAIPWGKSERGQDFERETFTSWLTWPASLGRLRARPGVYPGSAGVPSAAGVLERPVRAALDDRGRDRGSHRPAARGARRRSRR